MDKTFKKPFYKLVICIPTDLENNKLKSYKINHNSYASGLYKFFQLGSLVRSFFKLIVKTTFLKICELNYENSKGNNDNEIIDSTVLQ